MAQAKDPIVVILPPLDALWRLLRAAYDVDENLTQGEILKAVNDGRARPVKPVTVAGFLKLLEEAGAAAHLRQAGRLVWWLTKDLGEQTPVMREGRFAFGLPSLEQRLWKAARVLKRFDLVEIAMTAGAEPEATKRYLKLLSCGGYVRAEACPRAGRRPDPGSDDRWRFNEANYTGPRAPVPVSSYGFVDLNTGRTAFIGELEQVEAAE